jgi:hypothetical protein
VLVPTLMDWLAPRTASASRWGRWVGVLVLAFSVVSGAVAVRDAFEIAEGSLPVD